MCARQPRSRRFLQYLSRTIWHPGCVDIPAAVVGRPSRTVQTRQTGQGPTVQTIQLEGRLLSSNIGKLNRAEDRQIGEMLGSVGKTVISHLGDFFAVWFAPVTVARLRRAAGGAL